MGTAAPSFLNPIAAEREAASSPLSAEALARRAGQRRQIQDMIGASYVIDACILLLYGWAGTVPFWLGPVYAFAGFAFMALAILMSETGISERFKDHYMVAQGSAANMMIMVVFTYIAPQVGVLFLCSLFTVFSFASLRSTPVQTAIIWTAMALSLAGLFLLTDKPIGMPHGSQFERFTTMLVFTLTIGRCVFLGIFSSAMKASLYQRGLKLKEAYKRIEELAELDELTGSFNRRSIMRMLGEMAIAREARALAQYNTELATLERQTGTILESHGVRFAEERYRSIGPLGRLFDDRYYPLDRRPTPNAERYPPGEVPDLDKLEMPRRPSRPYTPLETEELDRLPPASAAPPNAERPSPGDSSK